MVFSTNYGTPFVFPKSILTLKTNIMNSISRASYSSRLTNAEALVEDLNTFTNFTPGDTDLTAGAIQTRTVALREIQTQHTQKHFDYSKAAFKRRQYFDKEENSISKLLSPIGANIRGKFGKDSQEYKEIRALILKIRGQRRIKITENTDEETISHSEKSFGSQIIYFGDLITLLIKFGSGYDPINTRIKISALQTVLQEATVNTNKVSTTLALYKPWIAQRINGFKDLSISAARVKDMVSSQYGLASPEYKMVKGLKI